MTVDLRTPAALHLVGIGGAGMSGLARVLVQRQHRVSGSDLKETRRTDELSAMGVRITIGHDAAAVGTVDAVVASTAVAPDNEELAAARAAGIPVLTRAELLAALMHDDRRVLVAGTHGKTTTTSMAVVALQAAGRDPSFAIGAQLNEAGTNAHAGTDALFVAEADESDRSLLTYEPDIAVVTNAELDHPDAYADEAEVLDVFAQFLAQRREGGVAVLCLDDPGTRALADVDDVVTYGVDPDADLHLVPEGPSSGRILRGGHDLARLDLAVVGEHNLRNATAALAVCTELGCDPQAAADGLARFTGAARRFQVVGEVGDVVVVDDYAHHPTELRASLAAARVRAAGRVVVVVQPHRYSRTRELGAELGRAAAAADLVYVTDVYGSGEPPEPGVSGRTVVEAAAAAGARVDYQPHFDELVDELVHTVTPGDLVLVTGAGDISQVATSLVRTLAGDAGDR